MLFHLRLLFTLVSMLWDVDPATGKEKEPPADPKPDKPTFDDQQQQWINDRLAAERKDAEARTATRLKSEAETRATNEREQRGRDEAEKRGEFDKVKTDLETKVSDAESKLESANAELDTLRSYVESDIDTVTKAVNASDSAKLLMDWHPGDDATTPQKLDWARKAKARLPELTSTKEPYRGNGPNPKPGGGETKIDENAAVAQARRTVRPI